MKKITIYTNKNCAYCAQLKESLEKENIKFKEIDTLENKNKWQEIVSLTGMPTTPTILYDKEYLVAGRDFPNPTQVINILKNFKSSSFDDSRKALERIKTLNYHINMAFGRLDQLLRQIEKNTKKEEDEHKSTD